MIKIIIIILIAEIWCAVGQILFKKTTNGMELQSLRGVNSHIKFMKNILTKPMVWLGLGAMTLGLLIWFAALAGADLSVVSPISSLQYILILFAAHLFLGEKINRKKLIGTLLVVLGIILIAMS